MKTKKLLIAAMSAGLILLTVFTFGCDDTRNNNDNKNKDTNERSTGTTYSTGSTNATDGTGTTTGEVEDGTTDYNTTAGNVSDTSRKRK
jgi:hypothetical protein